MKPIARIHTQFHTKFGVPRQSGIVEALEATIVFEPEFRNPEALRGLEGFSHIWLLWDFSEAHTSSWSPTVRPPRLGGNRRMGVFATRSPFRPNNIGLSSVRLQRIDLTTPDGPVLVVTGADLMDGTPIWDIKPYLPFTDCHPEATAGFAAETSRQMPLHVLMCELKHKDVSAQTIACLKQVLAQDPRPHYQSDPDRVYTMEFAGLEVKFTVTGDVLTVLSITELKDK